MDPFSFVQQKHTETQNYNTIIRLLFKIYSGIIIV